MSWFGDYEALDWIKVITPLTKKLLRDVWEHKYQFLALSLLVAIGVGAYAGAVSSVKNRKATLTAAYDELDFADVTVTFAAGVYLDRMEMQNQILQALAAASPDLVQTMELRLSAEISLNMTTETRTSYIRGRIIGLDIGSGSEARMPSVNALHIENGRYFEAMEHDDPLCIVEKHFSKSRHLKPGSTLEVLGNQTTELTVLGDAISPEYFMIRVPGDIFTPEDQYGVLFVPMKTAQHILGLDDQVNEILLKSSKGETLADLIREWISYNGIPADVFLKEDHPSYNFVISDAEGDEEMMRLLPLLVLLGAAFGIYISLNRLVVSQRREIGIVLAVGYSRRTILLHYLNYSLFIAALGSLLGIGLGWLLEQFMKQMTLSFYVLPSWHDDPKRFLDVYPIAICFSFILCILGGIVPAWNSARMVPVQAIYVNSSINTDGKASITILDRLIRPFKFLSVYTVLSLRNLIRARKRTLATIFGVSASVALLISFVSMSDTIDHAIGVAFDDTWHWDLRASFRGLTNESDWATIESTWPGVHTAAPAIETFAQLYASSGTEDIQLIGIQSLDNIWKIELAEGDFSSLVISSRTSARLGKGVGEEVVLEHLAFGGEFGYQMTNTSIMISGIVPGPFGFQSFLPLARLQEVMASGLSIANILYLAIESAYEESIRQALFSLPEIESVVSEQEMRDALNEVLDLLTTFMLIMELLCLLMGFTLIYNTISINMRERRREMATMRVVGVRLRTIFRIATMENLFLGLASILLGYFFGILLSQYVLHRNLTEGIPEFSLNLVFLPVTFAWVGVLVLITVLISQLPSFKYVATLNLAKSTRERIS